jgi:hypothetical protein
MTTGDTCLTVKSISRHFGAQFQFRSFNPLNAELNPICHLLALLGSATIVVVSRLRVKRVDVLFSKLWIQDKEKGWKMNRGNKWLSLIEMGLYQLCVCISCVSVSAVCLYHLCVCISCVSVSAVCLYHLCVCITCVSVFVFVFFENLQHLWLHSPL